MELGENLAPFRYQQIISRKVTRDGFREVRAGVQSGHLYYCNKKKKNKAIPVTGREGP
jgi:hypothetical protein